jgi:hypothetical protein
MANPLKLRTDANGVYNNGIQVMTDAELKYAASIVLAKLGSTTQDVGDIIFDTDLGTAVGTFVDNYANGALSSHPANTTTVSTTYTLYQNTAAASEASMVFPSKLETNLLYQRGPKPQTDADLNNSIIQACLDKIAAANSTFGEAGTYYITSNTNGTPAATGTWTVVSTVYDEITNDAANDAAKVTYNLYKRNDASDSPDANALDIPITIDSTTPSHLKQMTTAQLQELAQRLRNRITATGIGTYALQTSAPASGTWVNRGTITDRVPTINSVTYSRGDQYTRIFSGNYDRLSVGYSREYLAGQFVRAVYGTGAFTSTRFERQFTGQYARITIGPAYTPIYSTTVTRQYGGPQYVRQASYTSELSASEITALQQYTAAHTVIGSNAYLRPSTGYAGPVLSNAYTAQYVRDPGLLLFARTFQRASFTRIKPGPTYQRLRNTYRAVTFQRQYTRQFTAQYTGLYDGLRYSRDYTRIYTANYNATYIRQIGSQFFRAYLRNTVGPEYIRNATYQRTVVGPSYNRGFTRIFSTNYVGTYTRQQDGTTYAVQYFLGYARGFSRNNYTGDFLRSPTYIGDYVSPPPAPYFQYFRAAYNRGEVYSFNFNRDIGAYDNGTPYGAYFRSLYIAYFTREPFDRTLYTRSFSGNYDGLPRTSYVVGPDYLRDTNYTREFFGNYNRAYTRIYAANYTRNAAYVNPIYMRTADADGIGYSTGPINDSFGYTRINYSRIVVGPKYIRAQYWEQYIRGQFWRDTVGPQYNGPLYATVYLGSFIGNYARSYTGQFSGIYAQQFSRVFSGNYDRLTPGPQYASDFDQYLRGYTAQYTRATTGPQYTREFTGNTVRPANEVAYTETTTTLWLRVA